MGEEEGGGDRKGLQEAAQVADGVVKARRPMGSCQLAMHPERSEGRLPRTKRGACYAFFALLRMTRQCWSAAPPENPRARRPPITGIFRRVALAGKKILQRDGRPLARDQVGVFPDRTAQGRWRRLSVLPERRQLGKPTRHDDNRRRPVGRLDRRANAARRRRRVAPASPAPPTECTLRSGTTRRVGGETEASAR